MVIPDVDLGNLTVDTSKGVKVVPTDIVLQVVVIAFSAQCLGEGIVSSLLGVTDVSPLA